MAGVHPGSASGVLRGWRDGPAVQCYWGIRDIHTVPVGGGGALALEMGRGVSPACSKPDPVPIRLAARKTPCPNLEINTEFN